jgi:hypothetical protein
VALSQDGPGKDLPFAGAAPPEELQVLAPLIGTWNTKIDARPSLQDKDGYKSEGQLTGEWLHNKQFLRITSVTAGAKFRGESTLLYSYDVRKKAYRRWLFTSTGIASESEGQWDAGKRTMSWKGVHVAPGTVATVTDVFQDDRVDTTVLIKNAEGQTMVDVSMTAVRKK